MEEFKPRNFKTVLEQMLAEVPKSEEDLIERFNWHIRDGNYKAPEQSIHWQRVMATLEEFFPKPTEDWQFKVISIFTTKSVEELKEFFKNNSNG